MSLIGICIVFVYAWAVFCTSVAHAMRRDGRPVWLCALVVIVPLVGLCVGLSAG